MVFMKMDKSSIAFILIVIISWINPELIYNLNKSFIGKVIILIIIIFFSSSNIILGLLTIFMYFIILDKYRYVIEGMMTEDKIDTENTIGKIKTNEIKKNIKDFEGKDDDKNYDKNKDNNNNKNKIIISTSDNSNGVDIQDIRDSIASKDSNSFPLSKKMFKSTDDVEPFNNK